VTGWPQRRTPFGASGFAFAALLADRSQTGPMNPSALGTALRWGLMLLLGALAVWLTPAGGPLAFAGVVLAAAVAAGFLVKQRRNAWYALGLFAVVWGLWLGVAPADSSPYAPANTGYGCGSVFTPPDGSISEDAPPYLYRQCEAVVGERQPFVVLLLGLGTYAVVRSCRSNPMSGTDAEGPREAVLG
jgi:hypothetical protein